MIKIIQSQYGTRNETDETANTHTYMY